MSDDVPRRLKRFYRKKEEIEKEQNQGYNTQNYSNPEDNYSNSGFGEKYDYTDSLTNESQIQEKKQLNRIPSMDYEDLQINERNARDIEKFQQESQDKELALEEIEKFKRENNRMPTKKETEKIAENLFTQIKNNPIDYGDEEMEQSPRNQRRHGRRNSNQPTMEEKVASSGAIEENFQKDLGGENLGNEKDSIKDLFSDKPIKPLGEKDEFDLGLDSGDEDKNSLNDDSELEQIDLDKDSEMCPNCKQSADKIIYCPKCGLAYCKSCAKGIIGKEIICPKCGQKTKF
ncbi:MAG TPA: RING finger protein [archaeon]|nr:RING finger protein [archaeon]